MSYTDLVLQCVTWQSVRHRIALVVLGLLVFVLETLQRIQREKTKKHISAKDQGPHCKKPFSGPDAHNFITLVS